jgi:hypothetical protein
VSLNWRELTDDELGFVAEDLGDWVDWLRGAHRRLAELVQGCWPNHAGVVLQLAAWQEWWWAIYAPRLPDLPNGGDAETPKDEAPGQADAKKPERPVEGTHSGQQAIMWWDSIDRAEPRLALEFRGCQRQGCRMTRSAAEHAPLDDTDRTRSLVPSNVLEEPVRLRDCLPNWPV